MTDGKCDVCGRPIVEPDDDWTPTGPECAYPGANSCRSYSVKRQATDETKSIEFTIPIRTVSEANSHTHWRVRQKRAKAQRGISRMLSAASLWGKPRETLLPGTITLTRVAPRELDADNLAGSTKHVQDGVADALGINDRDPRVQWAYAQRKGPPKTYAVHVTIERTAK